MRNRMQGLIKEMLDGQILLAEALGEFEKLYIQAALERNGQHLSKTADALGIHRNTLSKRVAEYEPSAKPAKPLVKSNKASGRNGRPAARNGKRQNGRRAK